MKLDIIEIAPGDLKTEMIKLRNEENMDFLENLTGMDWGEEGGLGVIYQLESTVTGKRVAIKTSVTDRVEPYLPTVSDLWAIANYYEREVFDFYGIKFIDHPDMRRLFLREDWVGYPMRKDDDPKSENPLRMTNEPLADVTTKYSYRQDGTVEATQIPVFTHDDYVINMGPQHPSTHGVLHYRVAINGEIVCKVDPVLGYIHRGIEKLNENLTYPQTLALTDRLDYMSAMQSRHALCMCVEEAMGVEVSDRVKYIRTIMDELQRIDSHLLFFGCLANDLGATTPFLYAFRDREKILDIFEETCGGRLILNYNTIGGVMADIHPNFVKRVKDFVAYMPKALREYERLFTGNVIARNRMINVGLLRHEDAVSYGCTGGSGRASSWHNDVRKRMPYDMYASVDFKEIIRDDCDSYARYLNRMDEMVESLHIIEQLVDNIPEGAYLEKMKPIIKVPEGTYYAAVEASRGEFGVLLESHGDKMPYRLHYRSTGLPLVAVMDKICAGYKIADFITIGGTMDYVIPDIDR